MSTPAAIAAAGVRSAAAVLAAAVFAATIFTAHAAGAEPVRAGAVLRLFKRRCVECHGPSKRSGKLRLDSIDAVFRGGRSGPAIAAGKSAESILFQRIAPGAEKRMPPEKKADPLTAEEVELVRRWIDGGARAEAVAGRGEAPPGPVALPERFAPCFAVAGEPGGRRIAAGRGNRVEILELGEGDGKGKGTGAKKGKKSTKKAGPILRRVRSLEGPRDAVRSLAFSPDGSLLAAGDFGAIHVWETGTWTRSRDIPFPAEHVLCLVFSPDGERLAAGGGIATESGEIAVLDVAGGETVWRNAPHTDTVLGLDWSPGGSFLFTGAADRTSLILDAATGRVRARLEGHTHHVLAVAISPDGKLGVTASADRTLRLWDLENLESIASRGTFKPPHKGEVTAVRFLPAERSSGSGSSRLVISASGDGTARVWDTKNRRTRTTFNQPEGYLQSIALLAGGKEAVVASESGGVWVLDLRKNRVIAHLDPREGGRRGAVEK